MIAYYLTLVLIPFYAHPLLSYNVGGMTPIKVLGGAAFLWAIFTKTGSTSHTFVRPRSQHYLLLLIAILCLSMTVNMSVISFNAILRLISIPIFAITILLLVDTREKLFWSCISIIIGMNIASLYMIRQFGQYSSIYSGFRPGGIFGDPNYYAASTLAILPVAYFLWRYSNSKLLSWFCMASLITLGLGLLLSQSRGGWVAFAVMLPLFVYESRARIRALLFICCFAILLDMFSPVDITQRFSTDTPGVVQSNQAREASLQSGLAMIREKPVFGFGIGSYKNYCSHYNDLGYSGIAHNSYLEVAAENGIPVLVIFLVFCVVALKDISVSKRLHADDPTVTGILVGIRVGIVGFLVAATFLSAQYERIFWALYFLAITSFKFHPQDDTTQWNQDDVFDYKIVDD